MPFYLQGHRVPEARKQLWLCCTTSTRNALVNSWSITEQGLYSTHKRVNEARPGADQRKTTKEKSTAKFSSKIG